MSSSTTSMNKRRRSHDDDSDADAEHEQKVEYITDVTDIISKHCEWTACETRAVIRFVNNSQGKVNKPMFKFKKAKEAKDLASRIGIMVKNLDKAKRDDSLIAKAVLWKIVVVRASECIDEVVRMASEEKGDEGAENDLKEAVAYWVNPKECKDKKKWVHQMKWAAGEGAVKLNKLKKMNGGAHEVVKMIKPVFGNDLWETMSKDTKRPITDMIHAAMQQQECVRESEPGDLKEVALGVLEVGSRFLASARLALWVHDLTTADDKLRKALDATSERLNELSSTLVRHSGALNETIKKKFEDAMTAALHSVIDVQVRGEWTFTDPSHDKLISTIESAVSTVSVAVKDAESECNFETRAVVENIVANQGSIIEKLDALSGLATLAVPVPALISLASMDGRVEIGVPLLDPQLMTRSAQVDELDKAVRGGDRAVVAHVGMAGAGKSTLVRLWLYASTTRSRYAVVVWLNAEHVDEVEQTLVDARQELGVSGVDDTSRPLRERAKDVVHHMQRTSTKQRRSLIVFDNADRFQRLRHLVPSDSSVCDCVFTARDASKFDGAMTTVHVGMFEPSESVELLMWLQLGDRDEARRMTNDGGSSTMCREALALADEVGHLPLAVAALGRFAKAGNKSFGELLELVRHETSTARPLVNELAHFRNGESVMGALNAVIVSLDDANTHSLKQLSLLAPDRVPMGMLRDCATDQLHDFGLIEYPGPDLVTVHRLVQVVVRILMSDDERRSHTDLLLGVVVERTSSFDAQQQSTWGVMREYGPHAEALLDESVNAWVVEESKGGEIRAAEERRRDLLYRLADYFGDSVSALSKSVSLWEAALRLVRASVGDEHPEVATTLNNMAEVYRTQGQYAKALLMYEEALRILKAALGDDHPSVATTLNNMAVVYKSQGEHAKALSMFEEALCIRKAALGDDHPDVATTLGNMAVVYYSQGEHLKALSMYEEDLRISKAALGDDHPSVATTLNNMALLYKSQGEDAKALSIYEEALRIYKAALGDNHPSVATTLNNVAGVYHSQGEYLKALSMFEDALRLRKAALGDDHPDVATTLGNMAVVYYSQGEHAKALSMFEDALRIRKAAVGDDHPDVVSTLWWIDHLLHHQ